MCVAINMPALQKILQWDINITLAQLLLKLANNVPIFKGKILANLSVSRDRLVCHTKVQVKAKTA